MTYSREEEAALKRLAGRYYDLSMRRPSVIVGGHEFRDPKLAQIAKLAYDTGATMMPLFPPAGSGGGITVQYYDTTTTPQLAEFIIHAANPYGGVGPFPGIANKNQVAIWTTSLETTATAGTYNASCQINYSGPGPVHAAGIGTVYKQLGPDAYDCLSTTIALPWAGLGTPDLYCSVATGGTNPDDLTVNRLQSVNPGSAYPMLIVFG